MVLSRRKLSEVLLFLWVLRLAVFWFGLCALLWCVIGLGVPLRVGLLRVTLRSIPSGRFAPLHIPNALLRASSGFLVVVGVM